MLAISFILNLLLIKPITCDETTSSSSSPLNTTAEALSSNETNVTGNSTDESSTNASSADADIALFNAPLNSTYYNWTIEDDGNFTAGNNSSHGRRWWRPHIDLDYWRNRTLLAQEQIIELWHHNVYFQIVAPTVLGLFAAFLLIYLLLLVRNPARFIRNCVCCLSCGLCCRRRHASFEKFNESKKLFLGTPEENNYLLISSSGDHDEDDEGMDDASDYEVTQRAPATLPATAHT